MYGENTKYHSNPYIQGTTVPCDDYYIMCVRLTVEKMHSVVVFSCGDVHSESHSAGIELSKRKDGRM